MRRKFHTLDVFTDAPLAGNPLAVVLDAEGLDDARMQAIAREFNLSETVFVLAPRDPVNTASVRIFTPGRELPFAGHPTVGTAVLLAELHAPEILARQDVTVVLEEKVGPVSCIVRHIEGQAPRASFTLPRLPQELEPAAAAADLAAALGLAEADVGFDAHVPSVYSAGVGFTFVPLRSREAVARARPDLSRWSAVKPADHANVFVYARGGARPGSHYHARMFAPDMGVGEDPATGSAAAAFAGALMRFEAPADGDHTILIEQGFEMGRPSLITLGLDVAGGALTSASIGGPAVILQQGTIDV
ncbi:MAG: PhzF family phenazine biosynthesis protein [Methylobacteriaceae bacterium]|nr:PhzF family phenazine biosynthesis protein [Methylobacteriaceae bacterium]